MPPKRASTSTKKADVDGDFFSEGDVGSDYESAKPPPKKRARKSTTSAADEAPNVDHILALSATDLKNCDKEELVDHVTALQRAFRAQQTTGPRLSDEQLAVEVAKAKKLITTSLKRSMTWKPSCKTSGSKVVYNGLVVDDRVLPVMLGLKPTDKFKMKQLTVQDFENCVGECQASARYSDLYLRGKVTIKQDPAARTFSVSATYGVSVSTDNY